MSRLRKILLGLLLVGCLAIPAHSIVWNAGTFEAEPSAGRPVSEGDDRIRELKEETRFRNEVEMCFGPNTENCPVAGTGTEDNGRMRMGSARVFFQIGTPGTLSRADYDNAVGGSGSGVNTLDDGRLWVDEDTTPVNLLQVYDETDTAWEDVVIARNIHADDQILAGSGNLVYNGGFEATDGTGAQAATAVPDNFTAIDAATFTYGEGAGEDVRWGDGMYVIVTDVDGLDGMQTVLTNLAANTTYKVIARVQEADASDICTLATTGGLTNIAGEVSAGVAWQTLSGTFTTAAAALDTVTITFISTAAGDICHWDSIQVYQVGDVTTDRDEIGPSGIIALSDIETGDYAFLGAWASPTNVGSLEVTPPGPGYIIEVWADVSFEGDGDGNTDHCAARITEEGASVRFGSASASSFAPRGAISLYWVNNSPTPGTTYTYALQVQEDADACAIDISDNQEAYLAVKMSPTR